MPVSMRIPPFGHCGLPTGNTAEAAADDGPSIDRSGCLGPLSQAATTASATTKTANNDPDFPSIAILPGGIELAFICDAAATILQYAKTILLLALRFSHYSIHPSRHLSTVLEDFSGLSPSGPSQLFTEVNYSAISAANAIYFKSALNI
jgi:hypothetical protein